MLFEYWSRECIIEETMIVLSSFLPFSESNIREYKKETVNLTVLELTAVLFPDLGTMLFWLQSPDLLAYPVDRSYPLMMAKDWVD